MTYLSTKTYNHEVGLSCAFRQWRASSHCRYLHGYALSVRFEFEANHLDQRNWVIDFGALKPIKEWLVTMFDHRTLIAKDDPLLRSFVALDREGACNLMVVDAVGCEAFAKLIYEYAALWLRTEEHSPRVHLRRVEVCEHGANSAIYEVLR